MAEDQHLNLSLTQEADLNSKAAAGESFEQKMGFETYYKLGAKRSLLQTAKQLGRGARTVEEWAAKGRWSARVKERERAAAEYLLMQRSAEEEAKTKTNHLTLVDATISQWSKKLLSGEIKISKVEDLEKLIKLRWELAGMPDKRVNGAGLAANGGGGGMIDLRLRGMEREELQKFLHSTLSSISRITNRKGANAEPNGNQKDGEKFNLNIQLTKKASDAQPAKIANNDLIDVTPIADVPLEFDDLPLDFELPEIEDLK